VEGLDKCGNVKWLRDGRIRRYCVNLQVTMKGTVVFAREIKGDVVQQLHE